MSGWVSEWWVVSENEWVWVNKNERESEWVSVCVREGRGGGDDVCLSMDVGGGIFHYAVIHVFHTPYSKRWMSQWRPSIWWGRRVTLCNKPIEGSNLSRCGCAAARCARRAWMSLPTSSLPSLDAILWLCTNITVECVWFFFCLLLFLFLFHNDAHIHTSRQKFVKLF